MLVNLRVNDLSLSETFDLFIKSDGHGYELTRGLMSILSPGGHFEFYIIVDIEGARRLEQQILESRVSFVKVSSEVDLVEA